MVKYYKSDGLTLQHGESLMCSFKEEELSKKGDLTEGTHSPVN